MNYCVDCINFLTRIIRNEKIPPPFNKKKVRNALKKRGRVTIFWCRITGAYYINNYKVYKLKACEKYEDAGGPQVKVEVKIKRG